MNTRDLSNKEFAEHMRHKRFVGEPSSLPFDTIRKEFGGGVRLVIKREKTLSEIVAGADTHLWGIHIRVPRTHPWYGKEKMESLFGEDADVVGKIDYQYETESDHYMFSVSLTGSVRLAKDIAYEAAKRAAKVVPRSTSDGIATSARNSMEENLRNRIPE
jgi:hypothetical protein